MNYDLNKWFRLPAAAAGLLAGLLGGWDSILSVLMICMAIDYGTGLLIAMMGRSDKTENGRLDSRAGFRGLLKKALILAVILMAAQLDRILPGEQAVFRSMMCWFYTANEALSILENLALAGVPFPESLRSALEQLKQEHGE